MAYIILVCSKKIEEDQKYGKGCTEIEAAEITEDQGRWISLLEMGALEFPKAI